MRRTLTEVRTFAVKVYCDCGGQYTFNGRAQMTSPPQYVHACGKCRHMATFKTQYPTEESIEVGNEQEVSNTEE